MLAKPYRDYNSYLRELFGCRVQKITLDAGLTCPNRDGTLSVGGCIYCNERGSGNGASQQSKSITEQLANGKAYLKKRYKATKFLGYFQSFTNTYAPLPHLRSLYGEALADPDVVGLTIGTRPDCVSREVLAHLQDLSRQRLIWIEYGLQSANDITLLRIRRGHDVATFQNALRRTRARHIPVCAHVILGLPGEDREMMLNTARFVADHDIQAIKIHLLYVVRGTLLETWYLRGEYKCLSREEYVSIAGEFLALLPPHLIIQRVTGDPHPEELAAPAWALEKSENIRTLHAFMEKHALYQGKHYRDADRTF